MRSLIALVACLLLAATFCGTAQAGPFCKRRSQQSCQSFQQAPAYQSPRVVAATGCPCGASCACQAGSCPTKCPVQSPLYYAAPQSLYYSLPSYGSSCPGGRCGAFPTVVK